ncbi:general negative regulator of transcription subunit 4 [Podospora fimiseda]|uniref:General negative regulator of transcription subunit 4 n=1 Tax=Podospora fimiseda TaxID=252190 RepID=A0AAN7H969_9PEZI|nr:general negative regulator of transcription subunit 4 [Podospora fimiseda]
MAPQDTIFDDEDDCCPLCIEEFDLSDRNFRPCPCGYQICQFCFNNIRNNMNGLCPACRRPYDDKTIEWKVVTPEEYAQFRANIRKNQTKRAAEQRHKELQKREAEKENRKNLVGVRVVQKNLVYVTGLQPTVKEDELLKTLRKPEFFGQYGNIQKISISNRRGTDGHNQSLGVYVTFEKKEDAARCIQAVNHSVNGDRVLRAQLGTTKYCSAWLRNEQCTNRQCMFLHELGEEEDSYTRQDLSSMNSINTQRPIQTQTSGSSRSASRQQNHPSPAPAPAQPMVRSSSKDGSDNGDAPALPATANWARNPQVRSRRGSHATSGAGPSPAISNALPVTAESAIEDEVDEPPVAGPSAASNPIPAPEPASAPVPAQAPSEAKASKEKKTKEESDNLDMLYRILSAWAFSWPKSEGTDEYPPLFDPRGGERRKAREVEDLSISDQLSRGAREPSEGEPESSGSLALGGEPEDRELGRESLGFDPRRAAQPPIQRGNGDGFFGQAIGSGLTQTANLGSIGTGSRTMTPQQPAFMRPPVGFVDHLSNQTNLFQGQGHNRQGSRFSFTNDGRETASSTTVKVAANPRIMAQQSSMMPSSFHAQTGAPYYASTIPAPPPGLIKSTATPTGMYGQQGFGSAFGKDSNDIMQLINRGRAAGAQAHDAGKREYMFSFVQNQYPSSTSSTPAPASGHLASLYGNHPGAFQDLSSKQKKKGKKHRHANTSSTGGGGSVDLADPSILQVRMQSQQQQHMQQQSNAGGLGQGLFGGQSQDDELLSLEDVRTSVDALVADEPIGLNIRQPPGAFDSFAGGRSGTPSVPPGLGIPNSSSAFPSPSISHASLVQATLATRVASPVVVPKTPVRTPALPHAALPLSARKASAIATPSSSSMTAEAKKNIKALAAESGLSKEISSKAKSVLQDEDFPALNSPKPSSVATPVATPKPLSKTAAKRAEKAAAKSKQKAKEKEEKEKAKEKEKEKEVLPGPTPVEKKVERPVPGILNIAAATKASQIRNIDPASSAVDKSATTDKDSVFPALPTPTPVSVSSPLARTAPKTLRVVQTPKMENPPTPVGGGGPAVAAPSVRSLASAETPASELISDTASIISASISASRTNSPPPSRVGTAPVRSTTKSQQRKQRKEVLKKESAVIAAAPVKVEAEVEIGPILGRKKKQKKEKERTTTKASTPIVSRPGSPLASSSSKDGKDAKDSSADAKDSSDTVKEANQETSTYRSTANETTTLTDEPVHGRYSDSKGKNIEASRSSDSASNAPRAVPSPAAILKNLQDRGHAPKDIEKLPLFKPTNVVVDSSLMNNNIRPRELAPNLKSTMIPTKNLVTEEDLRNLSTKPIRKVVDGVSIMITPNGDCLRHLTKEEQDRFLYLQQQLAMEADNPAAFVSSKHDNGPGGFSLVKGRAVPNGPPSYMLTGPGEYPEDPINKIQREEAIYYINQYVLPRLNLSSRDLPVPRDLNVDGGVSVHGTRAPKRTNNSSDGHNAAGGSWMGKDGFSSHDVAEPELLYSGPVEAGLASIYDARPPSFESAVAVGGAAGAGAYLESYIDRMPGGVNATTATAGPAAAAAAAAAGLGNVPLMSLEDAEATLGAAKKEAEKLEKALLLLVKKNKRLLTASGGN